MAAKAEADSLVAQFSEELLADGRQRLVRHGAGPERVIQTLIGSIKVRRQKVRDQETNVLAEAKIRVTSNILPKRARRCKCLNALLPVLYLRGISPSCARRVVSDECELVSVSEQWQSVRPQEGRATQRERRRGSTCNSVGCGERAPG